MRWRGDVVGGSQASGGLPPGRMRCLALRDLQLPKNGFSWIWSCYTSGGKEFSGDNAAAATHRRHRRALVLVGEAVALADRQLFHRNLRRRRPFRAAAPRRPALRRARAAARIGPAAPAPCFFAVAGGVIFSRFVGRKPVLRHLDRSIETPPRPGRFQGPPKLAACKTLASQAAGQGTSDGRQHAPNRFICTALITKVVPQPNF